MKRPKKPARKLPNVETRCIRGEWMWRARVKLHGVAHVGNYRETQDEAYEDSRRLRERLAQTKQVRIDQVTIGGLLAGIEQRERARREEANVKRDFDPRRDFLLSFWAPDTPIERIDRQEIDWLVSESIRLKRSVPTIRKYLALLRQCFYEAGIVMPEVRRLPRQEKRAMTFFSQAEIVDILKRMRAFEHGLKRDRDVAVASFVVLTGVRSGEFLRLTTKHVDLERGTIEIIAKDRSNPRLVPITPALRPIVDELIANALPDGHFLQSLSAWRSMWRRWTDRLGITINGRLLRRSFITNAGYSGLSLADVRDLAGHKHSSTTDIYMQAISSRLHDAASHAQAFLDIPQADATAPESQIADDAEAAPPSSD
ncbi:MAG: site-specific integrase [Planctomycetes bacterium]|nr:site-specific integrase [Planctomycetota bacterium]